MKILICGAGKVGEGIARLLSGEGHEVTILDSSPELVERMRETLDVGATVGNGSFPEDLRRAGVEDTEMVIAATRYDEVNIVTCQLSKEVFGVKRVIVRVHHHAYAEEGRLLKLVQADQVISPERETARAALERLEAPGAFDTRSLFWGGGRLFGIRVEEDCPVKETALRELRGLFPDVKASVVGLKRNGELRAVKGDDVLLSGDEVYTATDAGQAERVLRMFGSEGGASLDVLVAGGGGRAGLYLARELEKRKRGRVRVVESNKERAFRAADELSSSVVLHGDALDPSVLREAGAATAHAVVTLTGSDETNLLASLMAKAEGCGRSVCRFDSSAYSGLTRMLKVDAHLNPLSLSISEILAHVRRIHGRGVRRVHAFGNDEAEGIEGVVTDSSPLVGRSLREFGGENEGIMVGMVRRDGETMTPESGLEFESGDSVFLFACKGSRRKAGSLFSDKER